MDLTIYTKPDCVYCSNAKHLASAQNWDFTEVHIGKDISRDDVIELFPDIKTVPIIVIDGELIGGYNQFSQWTNLYNARNRNG